MQTNWHLWNLKIFRKLLVKAYNQIFDLPYNYKTISMEKDVLAEELVKYLLKMLFRALILLCGMEKKS